MKLLGSIVDGVTAECSAGNVIAGRVTVGVAAGVVTAAGVMAGGSGGSWRFSWIGVIDGRLAAAVEPAGGMQKLLLIGPNSDDDALTCTHAIGSADAAGGLIAIPPKTMPAAPASISKRRI